MYRSGELLQEIDPSIDIDENRIEELIANITNNENNDKYDPGESYILYEGLYNDLYNKFVPLLDNPISWIIHNVTVNTDELPLLCIPIPLSLSRMLGYLSKNARNITQYRTTQFASEYLSLDFYNQFYSY